MTTNDARSTGLRPWARATASRCGHAPNSPSAGSAAVPVIEDLWGFLPGTMTAATTWTRPQLARGSRASSKSIKQLVSSRRTGTPQGLAPNAATSLEVTAATRARQERSVQSLHCWSSRAAADPFTQGPSPRARFEASRASGETRLDLDSHHNAPSDFSARPAAFFSAPVLAHMVQVSQPLRTPGARWAGRPGRSPRRG
jgi:hypothetical protein